MQTQAGGWGFISKKGKGGCIKCLTTKLGGRNRSIKVRTGNVRAGEVIVGGDDKEDPARGKGRLDRGGEGQVILEDLVVVKGRSEGSLRGEKKNRVPHCSK